MCVDCGWESWVEEAQEILTHMHEVPVTGEYWASSASETLESIAIWMEENEHVTDKQIAAIENIKSGLERWTNRTKWT